ncbi:MAG: hypothetical protein R3C15_11070 [Thermoleophilia bacterium]
MGRIRMLLAPVVATLALGLAACGGSGDGGAAPAPAGDDAWAALLAELGLEPGDGTLTIEATGAAPSLAVTISVAPDAAGPVTFSDGLYGAQAFALGDDGWERVDTAEVRTEIAPILEPGGSATLDLPVAEADGYRVLVPAEGLAYWADVS